MYKVKDVIQKDIKQEGTKYRSLGGGGFDEVCPVTSMWSKLYTLLSILEVTAKKLDCSPRVLL